MKVTLSLLQNRKGWEEGANYLTPRVSLRGGITSERDANDFRKFREKPLKVPYSKSDDQFISWKEICNDFVRKREELVGEFEVHVALNQPLLPGFN